MRDEHYWPAWDSDPVEHTGDVPAVRSPESNGSSNGNGHAADHYEAVMDDPLLDSGSHGDLFGAEFADEELAGELLDGDDLPDRRRRPAKRVRRGVGKAIMITGGVIGVLVVLYAVDLLASAGDVPRGVTVAGVEVGGMSQEDAEATLREQLEPRLTDPILVKAGDVDAELNPVDSGLGIDWPGTLEQAGHQPLSPITRVMSFFTSREVGVVTKSDPDTLSESVKKLAETQINHDLTEGSIGFQTVLDSDGGVTPFPIEPRQGQKLADANGATDIIKNDWLKKGAIEIPVDVNPTKVTSAGVHAALDQVVAPAVAKPVTVHGEDKDAVLKPDNIGGSLQFGPANDGALQVRIDQVKLQDALAQQLGTTEQDAKDAAIVFTGGKPSVEPSEDGREINWDNTFKPLMDVIKQPENRDIKVAYDVQKPKLTTEKANDLGIKEVAGEFTAAGFSGDVAQNVKAIAAQVNGTIVKPGETFSLDGKTGPRTASQGYVQAPVNEDGTGKQVIGGGVSSFTTALYNAAYFGGLKDAGHTAHDYWMKDMYIPGRDAKSLNEDGSNVDMKFTNDTDTGVAIQADVSGTSVTVRIWGTKHYTVDSATGDQSNTVEPSVRNGSGGDCKPSEGEPGFTTTDTRIIREAGSGNEVRTDRSDVTYKPKPTVVCG